MSCIYCEQDTMAELIRGDGYDCPLLYLRNGVLHLELELEYIEDKVEIAYCPMCGRKLGEQHGQVDDDE